MLAPLSEGAEIQQPRYFCISGTSMASPQVSGVVALMLQANPQATPAAVNCSHALTVIKK